MADIAAGIGEAADLIIPGASAVVAAFESISNAMVDFVSKSDPGLIAQFSVATDNLSASLGKMFEPFVASFIPWIDGLNNIFTKFGELIAPVTDAIGDLSSSFAELFASIGDAFIEALKGATPAIEWLADQLREMTEWVLALAKVIGELTNTKPEDRKKSLAVTPSSFAGAQDLGKQFQLAALNQGDKSKATASEQRESLVKKMDEVRAVAANILKFMQDVKDAPGKVVGEFENGLEQIQNGTAFERFKNGLDRLIQWDF